MPSAAPTHPRGSPFTHAPLNRSAESAVPAYSYAAYMAQFAPQRRQATQTQQQDKDKTDTGKMSDAEAAQHILKTINLEGLLKMSASELAAAAESSSSQAQEQQQIHQQEHERAQQAARLSGLGARPAEVNMADRAQLQVQLALLAAQLVQFGQEDEEQRDEDTTAQSTMQNTEQEQAPVSQQESVQQPQPAQDSAQQPVEDEVPVDVPPLSLPQPTDPITNGLHPPQLPPWVNSLVDYESLPDPAVQSSEPLPELSIQQALDSVLGSQQDAQKSQHNQKGEDRRPDENEDDDDMEEVLSMPSTIFPPPLSQPKPAPIADGLITAAPQGKEQPSAAIPTPEPEPAPAPESEPPPQQNPVPQPVFAANLELDLQAQLAGYGEGTDSDDSEEDSDMEAVI
jgi:hypothetical protein